MKWNYANACNSGLGEFIITDLGSGARLGCRLPQQERYSSASGGLVGIEPHRIRTFGSACELMRGYGLTNTGLYAVQATIEPRCFPWCERTNNLVTPPVIIRLSPR